MSRIIVFSAVIFTALLTAFFAASPSQTPRTGYAPMAGKLFSSAEKPQQADIETILGIPAVRIKTPQTEKKGATILRGKHRETLGAKRLKAKQRSPKQAEKVLPKARAEDKADVTGFKNRNALPQYVTEDIIQTFEDDLSKYPLKKSETQEGVSLRLIALENLDKMFIVKIAVDNRTGEDFFVKGFEAKAGGLRLEERSLFGVLVEARKNREGYILLAKPKKGARICLELKEDGGKRRAIKIYMDCPL